MTLTDLYENLINVNPEYKIIFTTPRYPDEIFDSYLEKLYPESFCVNDNLKTVTIMLSDTE